MESLDPHIIAGALIGIVFLFAIGLVVFLRARRKRVSKEILPPTPTNLPDVNIPSPREELKAAQRPLEAVPQPPGKKPVLAERLGRTRGSLLGRLGKFLGKPVGLTMLEEEWEEVEAALLEGDVGIRTTELLLSRIRERLKQQPNERGIRELIEEESEVLLSNLRHGLPSLDGASKPFVISIVGVNGAGKTTTIGKLSQRFHDMGKSVLLGAGDTFRAAAISQLKIWSDRTGSEFVTGREGADPGAVAFDSVSAAKARGIDVVLLDTAGRLHTKTNLMDELKKVHRVVKKVIPDAPHETWLIVDGTTGQNAIQQAKVFQEALDLTGIVVTKLDGTAKGGAILAIASELKLPIICIGVGESAEDLIPFEPRPFIEAIFGTPLGN